MSSVPPPPAGETSDGRTEPQYSNPESAGPQYSNPESAGPQYSNPQYSAPQYSAPQYSAPQYGAPGYAPGYAPQRPTNSMALVSLISGIAGLTLFPFVASIVAIVTGHMAKRQIAETGEEGSGMATGGLVTGYIGVGIGLLLVLLFVGMFAGMFAFIPFAVDAS